MNKPFKPAPILPILANIGISISDLKKNPAAAIEAAKAQQVAILNRNVAVAYIISPDVWDHIVDVFDDMKLAREMEDLLADDLDDAIEVSLDDL
jgi:antitoxin StbD